MDFDAASVEHALRTTRSVRRRLDFDRPVEPDVIEACIDVATQAPSPFTSILANIGNCASYLERANSRISSFVPGSWAPNWLQGKASTEKPRAWLSS